MTCRIFTCHTSCDYLLYSSRLPLQFTHIDRLIFNIEVVRHIDTHILTNAARISIPATWGGHRCSSARSWWRRRSNSCDLAYVLEQVYRKCRQPWFFAVMIFWWRLFGRLHAINNHSNLWYSFANIQALLACERWYRVYRLLQPCRKG